MAEDPRGGGVELHDAARLVDGDDGIESRLDDRPGPSLALDQLGLGLHAIGNVAQAADDAAGPRPSP